MAPRVRARPSRGRPTRDEAAAIDDRLRRAALDAFLERGFDGTTMEAVAAAAGISKRTLYAKYADKRALFARVVPWALANMPLRAEPLDLPPDDLEASLRLVAREVVSRVVEPHAVKLRRLAVLEAHRFPEFAIETNMQLWRQSVRSVVDLLTAHVVAGAIVLDDVELAADQFLALVAGGPTMLADLGVLRPAAEEARHLDHAVHLFLRGILRRAD